jgi:hypothetical protein
MSNPRALSPEAQARLRSIAERELSAEEVSQALAHPITNEERDQVMALVAWFRRRYPTPLERLAYARRAYRRWTAGPRNP